MSAGQATRPPGPPAGPSDADTPARPADAVEVGRILGAWGVKGGIKIKPFATDPQALFSSKRWFLDPADPPRPASAPVPPMLRVVQVRKHGDGVVATVHDVTDRSAAEALAGARVLVPRHSFPTPASGEYYWVDLIGCAVVDRSGGVLGLVTGLVETGPHSVLRVQRAVDVNSDGSGAAADVGVPGEASGIGDGRVVEHLIPFVDAYVDAVDLAARRIVVDWGADY